MYYVFESVPVSANRYRENSVRLKGYKSIKSAYNKAKAISEKGIASFVSYQYRHKVIAVFNKGVEKC